MNKKQKSILVILAILIVSTVYTYTAAGESSLNPYKQLTSEWIGKLESVIVSVKKKSNQQLQHEVTKTKERNEKEIDMRAIQESEQAIKEINVYQKLLKKQLTTMEDNPGVSQLINYESIKKKEITEDIHIEITNHLSDILSNR